MSSKNPIIIKNISKKYKIAHLQAKHHTIKDAIVDVVKKPLKILDSHHTKEKEEIWALKDVSFEVKPGQVMAVMGRNGSGKSTLFKVLSRITTPTSGEAIINGRVGSLIEVDAGFHPELTGRENVYFHGSILGMTTDEIDRNFDSILEFAEIDKYIDTPVKFFSSGMKVRLAFSVAIHMEVDILLLDEVLAVGDYIFKQKCFKVIGEMAKQGKTILFVSHIPAHIRRICTDGVLLKDGELVMQGTSEEILEEYLKDLEDKSDAVDEDEPEGTGKKTVEQTPPKDVKIKHAETTIELKGGLPNVRLDLEVENICDKSVENIRLKTQLKHEDGHKLATFSNTLKEAGQLSLEPQQIKRVSFTITDAMLSPGRYFFYIQARDDSYSKQVYHALKTAGEFVVDSYNPLDKMPDATEQKLGPVILDFDCEVKSD